MIIQPLEISKYYGATGFEPKSTRSLNHQQLIDYIEYLCNIEQLNHIEITLSDDIDNEDDQIGFMKFVFDSVIYNPGVGMVVEHIINYVCGCNVRFEDGVCFHQGEYTELEFEFE